MVKSRMQDTERRTQEEQPDTETRRRAVWEYGGKGVWEKYYVIPEITPGA